MNEVYNVEITKYRCCWGMCPLLCGNPRCTRVFCIGCEPSIYERGWFFCSPECAREAWKRLKEVKHV